MSQTEMISYWGYEWEEHTLITEDGYIITMHRIPRGKNEVADPVKQAQKTPVFLGHCLLGSSAVWTWGPPEKSFAYLLADQGKEL